MNAPREFDAHRQLKQRAEHPYTKYEREKADWIARHPNATPGEYSQAIRKIARRCGV